MDRFLIESPHEPEDCDKIMREIHNAGFLHFFDWGCHAGVHTGWAIIETDNLEHAKQMVPWNIRDKARIVKIERFVEGDPFHPHKPK